MKTVLVTGVAGFIGFHLVRLLQQQGGIRVVGIDNLNDYYSVQLKRGSLEQINQGRDFEFVELDVADRAGVKRLFETHKFDRVVHLAAQAGVRYSIENPHAYVDSNLVGMVNILEGCRHQAVPHLVYASSSSVYGLNTTQPFSVHQNVDHPISLYAATKKANELLAHTYSYLYQLPTTGLRFFTVYGPWGRPDMALFKFTDAILKGKPIDVFNSGRMRRDFTYVEDIAKGIAAVMEKIAAPTENWNSASPDPSGSVAPYRVYNIGNHNPVELMDFIAAIETALGKTAEKNMLPMQPGDVPSTFADVEDLKTAVGFSPSTDVKEGIQKFVDWYCEYYQCRI